MAPQAAGGTRHRTDGSGVGYFENYPTYAKLGYPLGSEIIEGACRHWDDDGGDAMVPLRSIECSEEWDETLKRRFHARRNNLTELVQAA